MSPAPPDAPPLMSESNLDGVQHHQIAGRTMELLAAFALLFVLQSGLAPFDFSDLPGKRSPAFFEINNPSIPDRLSNICLYVPIAFLTHWVFSRKCKGPFRAGFYTLAAAFLLSTGIEIAQHYSPARVSSLMDILCNVMGACVGVLLSAVCQLAAPRLFHEAAAELRHRIPAAAIKGYCAVLAIASALPFTFSLEISRLKTQLQTAVFVPFGNSAHYTDVVASAQKNGDHVALGYLRWQQMKRWSRWLAEALSFVLFAWLMFPFLRHDYDFRAKAAAAMTLWLGSLLAVGFSALQFTIISRGLDVTDILFRCGGIAAGLLTCNALAPWSDPGIARSRQLFRWHRLVQLGCACTASFIVFNGLIPPAYHFSLDGPASVLASDAFVPFVSYFVTRFDLMTADVVEKIAAYSVLASLMAADRRMAASPARRVWPQVLFANLVLCCAIEFMQIFNAIRVASLTDPILAAAGTTMGLLAYRYVERFHRFAFDGAYVGAEPSSRMSLTDELIAGLTEPSARAPVEPDVRPRVPRGEQP